MSRKDIYALNEKLNRPLVIPLMGYPGIQLTNSSIKQNEFNFGLHYWTIYELAEMFEPDGIFFLMDLSLEANALGLPVRYPLSESPTVEYHLVTKTSDLQQFMSLDPLKDGRIMAFLETARLMSQTMDILIGGFVIGPFTLAGLLMGANEVAIATIYDKDTLFGVLEFCLSTISRYAKALEQAGCDMIAILEPTAVMLSPNSFWQFSGQFIKRLCLQLKAFPIVHICGNSTHLFSELLKTGAKALSLDSKVDFNTLIKHTPPDVFLMGNIDPVSVMLKGTPELIEKQTTMLLNAMKPYKNFILSTGCDLPAETPLRNIQTFMSVGKKALK